MSKWVREYQSIFSLSLIERSLTMRIRHLLLLLMCFLSVLSYAKKFDAVLLNDSTKVFGKITYISDFVLHMDVKGEERYFFSGDVRYVMIQPGNFRIAQQLRIEVFNQERDFAELMEDDMLFGFRFILGNNPLLGKYSLADGSERPPRSMENYVYEINGRTFAQRVRSVGKNAAVPALFVLMLIVL